MCVRTPHAYRAGYNRKSCSGRFVRATRRKNAIKKTRRSDAIWNSKHVRTIHGIVDNDITHATVSCWPIKPLPTVLHGKRRRSHENQTPTTESTPTDIFLFFFQKYKFPPEMFDRERDLRLTTAAVIGFFTDNRRTNGNAFDDSVSPDNRRRRFDGVKRVFTERCVRVYKRRRSNYYIIYPQRGMIDERFQRQTRQIHFNRPNKQYDEFVNK